MTMLQSPWNEKPSVVPHFGHVLRRTLAITLPCSRWKLMYALSKKHFAQMCCPHSHVTPSERSYGHVSEHSTGARTLRQSGIMLRAGMSVSTSQVSTSTCPGSTS